MSQLKSAVLNDPRWRYPVGEGANRVLAGLSGSPWIFLSARGGSFFLSAWKPLLFADEHHLGCEPARHASNERWKRGRPWDLRAIIDMMETFVQAAFMCLGV